MKLVFMIGLLMTSTAFATRIEKWDFMCDVCSLGNKDHDSPFLHELITFDISIKTSKKRAVAKLNSFTTSDYHSYKAKRLEFLEFKQTEHSINFTLQTDSSDKNDGINFKFSEVECDISNAPFARCGACYGKMNALYSPDTQYPGYEGFERFDICPVFE
ncbi:MAG: hypothetical protein ACXWRE_11785 [Pseudobdellovibrionaceae bacterium]